MKSVGLVNANDSIDFDEKSKDVIAQSSRYGKFLNYFSRKLQPSIEAYVNGPAKESRISKWTNNNAESLNHVMKPDADWKVQRTPELIEMLYEMTLLHFKDLKRSIYGEGNYRLHGKHREMFIPRSVWKTYDEVKRSNISRK